MGVAAAVRNMAMGRQSSGCKFKMRFAQGKIGVRFFTLTFSLLTGVGIHTFHPHPNPLPEGEGVCCSPEREGIRLLSFNPESYNYLPLSALREGVGIRAFHPHPSPLPEGEGVCCSPEGEGVCCSPEGGGAFEAGTEVRLTAPSRSSSPLPSRPLWLASAMRSRGASWPRRRRSTCPAARTRSPAPAGHRGRS